MVGVAEKGNECVAFATMEPGPPAAAGWTGAHADMQTARFKKKRRLWV
jgi:hypothetical protein